jgi:hypothetical protein
METKKFTIINVHYLKIDDLFALYKSTIGYADPVSEIMGALLNAILAKFKAENYSMEQQMNKATKNVLTPQLLELKADRTDRDAEIKRNVTTALKGRNAEKKAAAQHLKVFLAPYWDLYKKPVNTQTMLYYDLLNKFEENELLQTSASTIGISDMFEGLSISNNNFDETYQIRLTQEAAEGPSATSLRASATNSYNQFCIALEQAVNYTPSEGLDNLFNQLDELRKTYARMVRTDDDEEPTLPPAE